MARSRGVPRRHPSAPADSSGARRRRTRMALASAALVASMRSLSATLSAEYGDAFMLITSSAPAAAWAAIGPEGLQASSQIDTPTLTPPIPNSWVAPPPAAKYRCSSKTP